MSSQPFSRASLHGAVDLSGLKQQQVQAAMSGGQGTSAGGTAPGQAAPGAAAPGGQPGGQPGAHDPRSTVVAVDLDSFGEVLQDSAVVPAVLVLWSPQIPGALEYVQMMERLAIEFEGRFRLATGNVAAQPEMLQAFQIPELPEAMTIAVMMGQPMPLYAGVQPEEEVRAVMQNLLQAAAQNGVTGRAQPGVSGSVSDAGDEGAASQQPEQPVEEPLSPHVQAAYDAIDAGDFAAAVAAFDARLAEEPGDEEARLGRQQVVLLERAGSLDANAVRQAAASEPGNVEAQMQAADLDLMGGHVEDAFARLIDTVKVTTDEERNAVRERLLELFEMVGSSDPRVRTARSQLMSALF
ncbi:co-chaperone YbbN [Kytococcus sedentarius]|uniref:co-chaperone YbbN n=1 Tax=Kytococcus sedentarius TaxID=1276 RepID=UPI003850D8C3